MKNPKVGDRVAIYVKYNERITGTIYSISSALKGYCKVTRDVMCDEDFNVIIAHKTHLVRLVKRKPLKTIWVNCYTNGAKMVHDSFESAEKATAGGRYEREIVEFQEVRKKRSND